MTAVPSPGGRRARARSPTESALVRNSLRTSIRTCLRARRVSVLCAGALVAVAALLVDLAFFARAWNAKRADPHLELVAYVLLPAIMAAGLGAVLFGARRARAREGEDAPPRYPPFDLNDPKQRRRLGYVAALGFVFFIVFSYAGYQGYELTESARFCGKACHTQMEPEDVTHHRSSHARVRCVECHVGSGARAYVTSKVNGAEQLLGVLSGHYARPIPTPAKDLPPARETCEACHQEQTSGRSSSSAKLHQRARFGYDEASSPDQIVFLLRAGRGAPHGTDGTDMHWHRLVDDEITYAAADGALQDIPWVRVKHSDGSATEYTRLEKKLEPGELAKLAKRTMDCIDCHNRPAHELEPPDVAVDRALSRQTMPRLPWAKSLAVDLLSRDYPSRDAAHDALTRDVRAFYEKRPEPRAEVGADVDKLTAAVIAIYDANVFPDMRVSWKSYPSSLGHRDAAGCFRCHDGKHVSSDGKVLTRECDACHTKPQRGPQTATGEPMASIEKDWHPWRTPEKHLAIAKHAEILCHECHVAGRRPKTDCGECHSH